MEVTNTLSDDPAVYLQIYLQIYLRYKSKILSKSLFSITTTWFCELIYGVCMFPPEAGI